MASILHAASQVMMGCLWFYGYTRTLPGMINIFSDFVIPSFNSNGMSSFWWNFHHWLHQKLSFWQPLVNLEMEILLKWWYDWNGNQMKYWWNFHHWLHRKLTTSGATSNGNSIKMMTFPFLIWQLLARPSMKIHQHFHFDVVKCTEFHAISSTTLIDNI